MIDDVATEGVVANIYFTIKRVRQILRNPISRLVVKTLMKDENVLTLLFNALPFVRDDLKLELAQELSGLAASKGVTVFELLDSDSDESLLGLFENLFREMLNLRMQNEKVSER